MKISIIVAIGKQGQIGLQNKIPWHIPSDLKNFKKLTMNHHIVMGRKTFESIGRPLPGRTTLLISRSGLTLEDAISQAAKTGETELFICGGALLYEEAMNVADRIYLTRVDYSADADTFFLKLTLGPGSLSMKKSFRVGPIKF